MTDWFQRLCYRVWEVLSVEITNHGRSLENFRALHYLGHGHGQRLYWCFKTLFVQHRQKVVKIRKFFCKN